MFERFGTRARRVIFFARSEASQEGSRFIETEHLLLGLLRVGLDLVEFTNLKPEVIRREIEALPLQRPKASASEDVPLSHESKRVLDFAAEECARLGHPHVGSEHLLLGLLREEKCLAADILHKRGVRLSQVREEIAKTGPREQGSARFGMTGGVGLHRAAQLAGQFGLMAAALRESARVLYLARHEAVQRHSACIETADLLLALTHEKEVAERFLVPVASVRRHGNIGLATPGEKVSPEELPFSEDFKLACTFAVEEAARLGQPPGPGHLLLGILRVESCAAAKVLRDCGSTAAGIRALLAPPPPPSDSEQGRSYV
jgi:ATP-dependent Clp protease ATP-binding subunit ClpA